MKKSKFLRNLALGLLLMPIGCGSESSKDGEQNNQTNGTSDILVMIDKFKEDESLSGKEHEKIKNLITNELNKNKADVEVVLDKDNALSINSYDLFNLIYSDRSVNLKEYLGKTVIIKDIYLYDIKTLDRGDQYVKIAQGILYCPKTNSVIDHWKMDNLNGAPVNTNYDIKTSKYKVPISIEFKDSKEMDKIGLLKWESADIKSFNGLKKVDIICKFDVSSISYLTFSEPEKNMKVYDIELTLNNASIYLPEPKPTK